MMSNELNPAEPEEVWTLTVDFYPDKPPSIPLDPVALRVLPRLTLNGLVNKIEYYYTLEAMRYGIREELQVIYLWSRNCTASQFNYNMPVKTYFCNGDTILCHGEIVLTVDEQVEMVEEKDKLPVTIITGFLGAGKTTLLNRILEEKHGKRIMVIQNEFGSIEIDGTLAEDAMFSKEDIQILDNGCACCTVRGDLGNAFGEILEKSKESDVSIEHIIIETTGLANPGPIIQTFYQVENVAMTLKLDGILTVIDAKNVLKHIDEIPPEGKVNECVEQVSFADRILLNKMDLVTGHEAQIIKDKIRSINSFAKIIPTTQSKVDLSKILNIRAFSLEKLLEKDSEFLKEDDSESEHTCDESDCSHHETGDHNHDTMHEHHEHGIENHGKAEHEKAKEHEHHHKHENKESHHHHDSQHDNEKHEGSEAVAHGKEENPKKTHKHKHKHKRKSKTNSTQTLEHSSGVSSLGFEREGEVVEERFAQFMSTVIGIFGPNIYRAKGIINISGNPNKLVFHGVHELFDTSNETPWGKDEKKTNKLVFIGKDLPRDVLLAGFGHCLKASEKMKLDGGSSGFVERPLKPSDGSVQSKKTRTENAMEETS